ncbi:MAG: SLBB domain-containing protein [Verrucomicrobiae bacterium]|nr:SLBB domain-containing protein [Verrucomicrobiae bacterium]
MAMPVDAVRRQVRAEIDQMPAVEPVSNPSWHRQYTLGPGDSLNFSMYDRADLARLAVPIAPDGTISYLQAVGIKAVGRSIPELRRAVEQSLSKYHKNPRVIVTPATIGSKRFTIIGRVREPGSYLLDRPTSILEGIATAKGIEVGSIGNSAFELADLERSFVVRNGRKLQVDLADLYFQGKLSENAYLEPNDYIYIASSLRNEIYVLGEVNRPGRLKMVTPLTVTRAITEAGGYNRKAYKQRVLLVRGSIHKPEVQVVEVDDVLHGRAPDVALQNRDIVFVDNRPFQIAERALDSAIFTFVQTVTSEVVNDEFLKVSIPAQ